MNGTGGMFFGGGFMWIFWILIIVFIIYAIKAGMGNSTDDSSKESPLEILKKRYARGEINEEEYERRRKELEQ